MTPSSRPGQHPGDSGAREAILQTARRHFADLGYDRTTLRGIAADAGVDTAVVSHFRPKQRLFAEAAPLPLDPEPLLADLLGGPRETIGHRLAGHVLSLTEAAEGRQQITGLIRAASGRAAPPTKPRLTALLQPPSPSTINPERCASNASPDLMVLRRLAHMGGAS